jgi:signal transduction histidine kinase/ligand-binding sensor domain-containing protein/CheY-like chemotaxis protein/AraC-like DNA-binding protein
MQKSLAQLESYREFDNFIPGSGSSMVYCFMQDHQGLIWFGTDKGLYSYDGYSAKSHLYNPGKTSLQTTTKINCGILIDHHKLCLGTDNGLLVYNTYTDNYEPIATVLPSDIRSLAIDGNDLWIGSLGGLFIYNIKNGKLKEYTKTPATGIPHRTVYSVLISKNKVLYVGTYNGLCYYNKSKDLFELIKLPVQQNKNSLLVNALYEDTKRQSIWIGTEGYLFCYHVKTKEIERIKALDGNSVKSLATDNENNLLAGTDNGLYIYNPESANLQQILHDSRNVKSLINNIIWTIFIDHDKNAWFGTDYGFSHYRYNKAYRFIQISDITGSGAGNQLQCIYKDSRGYFWLGGTNGLISLRPETPNIFIWYKMGNRDFPVSHNRIRNIYEDPDKQLWVATDGSINRYDFNAQQFIHYNIVDKTLTRNANWSYGLQEDKQGRLWIATYLGGVFVTDKAKLITEKTKQYIADNQFNIEGKTPNESARSIQHIVKDKKDNIWVLTSNNILAKIDSHTGIVTRININPEPGKSTNGNATCMIYDNEGYIRVGYNGGLCTINPLNNSSRLTNPDILKGIQITSMTDENNRIWLTTTNGVYYLNKKRNSTEHVQLANKDFSCGFYDTAQRKIYFGSVDGYIVFPVDSMVNRKPQKKIILTGLLINDRLLQAGKDYQGNSIRNLKSIKLKYNQSNITFEFSDLAYAQDEDSKYIFRLNGTDQEWRTINSDNRISYSNLPPGDYMLTIGTLPASKPNPDVLLSFAVTILPPWYYSFWAKLIYLFLIIGLIVWIIKYFRDKHQAKIELIEREKSLELSKMKIDFFTNISHDFKTPLSLIVGPVSKLLLEQKNPLVKKQLKLIQKNALHLNSLIQQVIGFERQDGDISGTLILSHIEFVEFCKGIFSVYDEGLRLKNIDAVFKTDIQQLNLDVDVVKMESVLNNLLSNALKYTGEGGQIVMQLTLTIENKLQIELTDNGTGIPANDLPYIFNRFYQSEKTKHKQEGTGIGLYLVKQYVDLHGGNVSIISRENEGTNVTLILPVSSQSVIPETPVTSDAENKNRPLALIVEDNNEVSEFLRQILQDEFRCIMAHNGKSGLDAALEHHPTLIITDVMMPVMDGMEMCRRLRRLKEFSLTPIIMLTAKDDKLTEEKSLELEVNAFIPKPFDAGMLLLRAKQLTATSEKLEEKIRLESIARPKVIEITSHDEKFLNDITRIIEEKIADNDLNVNSLSNISGISTKQIYRRIKQLTGQSPVDYIRSIRLKKAAMLLSQRKFSVAEVMYLVGFSNSSYFSKCFHSMFGKTPRQFMEEV